jgi:hypothetical protein
MTLDAREGVVLRTLQKLPKDNIVLIGGYAVNAYVPPRFSIDCDLVVLGNSDRIESSLARDGFKRVEAGNVGHGKYVRYETEHDKVSFDLLANSVVDRDTTIAFEAELFKRYSAVRTAVGRAAPTRIKMLIANPELLFAMKFVAGRRQDVRDIFMLSGAEIDWSVVRELISGKCEVVLTKERSKAVIASITSKTFKDSLQGPYGRIPDKRFDACKKNLTDSLTDLSHP